MGWRVFSEDTIPSSRVDGGEWSKVITITDRHTQPAKFKPTKTVKCFISLEGGEGGRRGEGQQIRRGRSSRVCSRMVGEGGEGGGG